MQPLTAGAPWRRLLAGGLAGMASRAAVAPLERMRTMFMADQRQTSMKGASQGRHPLHVTSPLLRCGYMIQQ